jgi:hypothetical protein
MALPTAFTAIVLAGLTYLMQQKCITLINPTFDDTGHVIGAATHTTTPTIAELVDKNKQATIVATALGASIADVVEQMHVEQYKVGQSAILFGQRDYEGLTELC